MNDKKIILSVGEQEEQELHALLFTLQAINASKKKSTEELKNERSSALKVVLHCKAKGANVAGFSPYRSIMNANLRKIMKLDKKIMKAQAPLMAREKYKSEKSMLKEQARKECEAIA